MTSFLGSSLPLCFAVLCSIAFLSLSGCILLSALGLQEGMLCKMITSTHQLATGNLAVHIYLCPWHFTTVRFKIWLAFVKELGRRPFSQWATHQQLNRSEFSILVSYNFLHRSLVISDLSAQNKIWDGRHVPNSLLSPGDFVIIAFPLLAVEYSAEHPTILSRFLRSLLVLRSTVLRAGGRKLRTSAVCVCICYLYLLFAYDLLYVLNLTLLLP